MRFVLIATNSFVLLAFIMVGFVVCQRFSNWFFEKRAIKIVGVVTFFPPELFLLLTYDALKFDCRCYSTIWVFGIFIFLFSGLFFFSKAIDKYILQREHTDTNFNVEKDNRKYFGQIIVLKNWVYWLKVFVEISTRFSMVVYFLYRAP